jgi:drug/metabolite transporter (DMT)-like permease
VYVIGVYLLGDQATPRGTQAILLGLAGAIVIVAGGWPRNLPEEQMGHEITILLMAVGSGVFYGGVILFLRHLRHANPAWLVFLNQIGSAVFLALFVLASVGPEAWWEWLTTPTPRQVAFLAVFGVVQMAIPYWLVTRGLQSVSSQEAGLITLLEPLLNPVWAYLITPEKDRPTVPMVVGGAFILSALIWRYLPRGKNA